MKRAVSGLMMAQAMLFALLMLAGQGILAADAGPPHRIVFHVSTDDERTQTIALNNAVNAQKSLGMDNVVIEIVANGPGLSMLTEGSSQATRVPSLAMQEITFSACGNTMKKVAQKTGKEPVLLAGVRVVPGGIIRIMELQGEGYTYIKP